MAFYHSAKYVYLELLDCVQRNFKIKYLVYVLLCLLKLWSSSHDLTTDQSGWFFRRKRKHGPDNGSGQMNTLKNTLKSAAEEYSSTFIPNKRMLSRSIWSGRVLPYNSVYTDSSHIWLRTLTTSFGFKKPLLICN